VLDKTGTLTLGVSKVTGIVAANGASEEAILQFAVIAEQHSEHLLGEAIVRSAKERGVSPRSYSDIQYVPGKGIVTEQQNRIVVGTPALFKSSKIHPCESRARVQLIRRAAQLDSYAAAFRDRGRLGSLDGWTMVVNVRTCAV
jgi:cation transport ATPase